MAGTMKTSQTDKAGPLVAIIVVLNGLITSHPGLGQNLYRFIIGEDDRVRLEEQGPPWDAIGQINISGYRLFTQCTGSLVAPNVAITAAHCVMNPWTGTPFPLHDIHFLAGVRGSDNKGHSTAKCLRFLNEYQFVAPEKIIPGMPMQVRMEVFRYDVVAIVLNNALGVDPVPLAQDLIPRPGLPLTHVGYPADHRFAQWAHFDCHLLRSDIEGPLWFNDCDSHEGSSDGPVFADMNGTPALSAIMVGGSERISNLALPVTEWRDLVGNADCQ